MKDVASRIVTIMVVVVLLVSGCGAPAPQPTSSPWPPTPLPTQLPRTPAPTQEVMEPEYSNPAWGLSMWYPEDWIVGQETRIEVFFGTSEEAAAEGPLERGAKFRLMALPLQGESLEDTFQLASDQVISAEMTASDTESRTIGGQDGLIVTFEGAPVGVEAAIRGFLAAAEYDEWLYLVIAGAVLEEWPKYGPDLEAMLDSVRFTSRTVPTSIPSETMVPNYTNAGCGLSMWYPEDWIYEEAVDRVTFATSEEAITTYPLETGAFMMVVCGDLEDQTFGAWNITLANFIVSILGLESFLGEARTIGGQEGYLEPMEGAFEDGQFIVGFTAAVEYEGWGYFFAAVTPQDEMAEYKPVLMTMLDSVQFDASTRPTATVPGTPTPTIPTSQYPPGAYTQGFHHYECREYEEAIVDFTKAINTSPNYLPSYISRGNAYRELGEYEEAIADFNEAIRLDPDYSRAYYTRGEVYRELAQYEEAIADFTEAIRLEPNFLPAYVGRGNTYRALGEYEEAIADYSERIRRDSDYAEAYYNRGECHRELGQYAEAIADFESYLRLAPPEGEFRKQAQDYIEAMQEQQ